MNKHVKVYANPECPREFIKRPFLSAQHQAIAFLVWAEQREKGKKPVEELQRRKHLKKKINEQARDAQ